MSRNRRNVCCACCIESKEVRLVIVIRREPGAEQQPALRCPAQVSKRRGDDGRLRNPGPPERTWVASLVMLVCAGLGGRGIRQDQRSQTTPSLSDGSPEPGVVDAALWTVRMRREVAESLEAVLEWMSKQDERISLVGYRTNYKTRAARSRSLRTRRCSCCATSRSGAGAGKTASRRRSMSDGRGGLLRADRSAKIAILLPGGHAAKILARLRNQLPVAELSTVRGSLPHLPPPSGFAQVEAPNAPGSFPPSLGCLSSKRRGHWRSWSTVST